MLETSWIRRGLAVAACSLAPSFVACGDDSAADGSTTDSVSDDDDDDDDAVDPDDGPPGPGPGCGGQCASFQSCIDNVCQPGPMLPACETQYDAVPADAELPVTPSSLVLSEVVVADLVSDERDDLVVAYVDRISVVLADGLTSTFELIAEPGDNYAVPLVGELTGDDIPDLLVARSGRSEMLVYAGDGLGGFNETQVVEPMGENYRPSAVGDLDGDGHHELFAFVDDSLHWLRLEDGALVDQGTIGESNRDAALRPDANGDPELWSVGLDVRVHRGPPWTQESLAVPLPADVFTLGFGRYSGRTDSDVLLHVLFQGRAFVLFGDHADALHLAEVPESELTVSAGDVDGDGLDDALFGSSPVVLGLAGGTSDDPFAEACYAEIFGPTSGNAKFGRVLEGDGIQLITWDTAGDNVPVLNMLEPRE